MPFFFFNLSKQIFFLFRAKFKVRFKLKLKGIKEEEEGNEAEGTRGLLRFFWETKQKR